MVMKRCIPTRFFKDPDIINLRKDTQLILIGLVLNADDEGREVAHAKVLGLEMDYCPDQIEAALQELVENHLVVLYQAGRHRYYSLTQQWQNLGAKMTPSKYPAPPPDMVIDTPSAGRNERSVGSNSLSAGNNGTSVGTNGGSAGTDSTSAGTNGPSSGTNTISGGSSAQSKRREENRKEEEGESLPKNVTPFPSSPGSDGDCRGKNADEKVRQLTQEVAAILCLPVTDALQRVVMDFLPDPHLSLLGEADMAREYIEDPKRNQQQKTMTLAFYRRWLKREQDNPTHKRSASVQTRRETPLTGTDGLCRPGLASRSLMHLGDDYQQTSSPPQTQKGEQV